MRHDTGARAVITVAGARFTLAPDVDLDDLDRRVTDAVRAGGGMVHVGLDGGDRLAVLVTAHLPVLVTWGARAPDDRDPSDGRGAPGGWQLDLDAYDV